jgi:sigma-B regulation protein RsbQ
MDVETIRRRHYVTERGRGTKAMVFAHGFGCDQSMWRYSAPAFEDEYRVVLFDYVGAGRSDLSAYDGAKYGRLEGYAADVVELCRGLGLGPCVFVGHSVSAMIGLLAAVEAPELFERLVMVGPSPCYVNDGDYVGGFERADIEEMLVFLDSNYLGWSEAMGQAIMGRRDRPELGEELTNSFCRTDPDIARQFARLTFLSDCRGELGKLRVPALILQCQEDVVAPVEVGRYLRERLAGSELREMEATGHCPHLSAPEEVVRLVREYLRA